MKCDVCGSDNLEGAAYCEDCGAKLVVAHAMAGGSSAPAPPPVVDAQPVAPPPVAQPMAPVGGSVQCPSCGADNPSSEAYCVDCGANLGTGPAPDTSQPVSSGVPTVPPATPVAAATAARLSLANGTKTYTLDKEITTMGRRSPADQIEPDIDLTDDDPDSYVSRRHAQILRNDDHYVFEDVGSSNGSFVNNARVQAGVQQILKDGDKLRLGKTEFVFSER